MARLDYANFSPQLSSLSYALLFFVVISLSSTFTSGKPLANADDKKTNTLCPGGHEPLTESGSVVKCPGLITEHKDWKDCPETHFCKVDHKDSAGYCCPQEGADKETGHTTVTGAENKEGESSTVTVQASEVTGSEEASHSTESAQSESGKTTEAGATSETFGHVTEATSEGQSASKGHTMEARSSESGHTEEGHSTEGDFHSETTGHASEVTGSEAASEGHTTESGASEGSTQEGHSTEGGAHLETTGHASEATGGSEGTSEGHTTEPGANEGSTQEGHNTEGGANSETTGHASETTGGSEGSSEGHTTESGASERSTQEGQSTEGHTTESGASDGHTTEVEAGQTTEGHEGCPKLSHSLISPDCTYEAQKKGPDGCPLPPKLVCIGAAKECTIVFLPVLKGGCNYGKSKTDENGCPLAPEISCEAGSSSVHYDNKDAGVAIAPGNVETCITPGCVLAASNLINAIDFSKDPCDDFSLYACGKWQEDNPIPDDLSDYSIFTKVRETVKTQMRTILEMDNKHDDAESVKMTRWIYNSCMDLDTLNEQKTTPLRLAIKSLGGWPLLNAWSEKMSLTNIMGKISSDYGLDTFLSLSISADQKNTAVNILTIDQGDLALGSSTRDYLLNDTLYKDEIRAYRKYILDHIDTLSQDMGLKLDNESVGVEVDKMIAFEKQLANITVAEDERRNQSALYNKWTVQNVTDSMKSINWMQHLRDISPKEVYDRVFLNKPNYEIIVTQPGYMGQLDQLLQNTDKKVLFNYVIWMVVKSYSKFLDQRFDDIRQELLKVFSGRQQKPVRWKNCVPVAINSLDLAAGALYAKHHFHESEKIEALSMIKNLKGAFTEIVLHSDWMDDKTKKIAVEKLDAIIDNVGYPDFVMDKTKLDKYYENVTFKNDTAYFDMNVKTALWAGEKNFLELLKPFDRKKFEISAAVVNAYYSWEKNSINFPAGILQPPFFKGNYPKSVNYGGIGAVIGHEMTHGFDDQGSQFDKLGTLHNWWSQSAFNKFTEKTKCIVQQYGNYSIPGIEQKVNGKLTQGENIADNGGVKQAFKAYQKFVKGLGKSEPVLPGLNSTSEQVFFLSYAQVMDTLAFFCGNTKEATIVQQILTDPHSPEQFRINGPLSNLDEFAFAFQCKPGTRMNPETKVRKKCSVW